MNLNLKLDPKAILAKVARYKALVLGVAVLSVFGYTAYQLLPIFDLAADETAKEALINEANKKAVKLDTRTLNTLKAQNRLPVKADTSNLGKADPFSP